MMDSDVLTSSIPARQSLSSQNRVNLKVVSSGDQAQRPKAAPEQNREANAIDQEAMQEKLEHSVQQLSDLVQSVHRDLQFSIDNDSGETVITVLDSLTEEVIRQIPSKEVLALARNIESLKGALFSAEV